MLNQAAKLERNEPAISQHLLEQIEACVSPGCAVRIEHTSEFDPHYACWETWGKASLFRGDLDEILQQLASCHMFNYQHVVRLSIEDYKFRSRVILVTQQPAR